MANDKTNAHMPQITETISDTFGMQYTRNTIVIAVDDDNEDEKTPHMPLST